MSKDQQAFVPSHFTPYIVSVGAASASVAVPLLSGATAVRILNLGASVTFFKFAATGGSVSSTTGIPLLANSCEVLSIPPDLANSTGIELYVIGTAGNTVYATFGKGL